MQVRRAVNKPCSRIWSRLQKGSRR